MPYNDEPRVIISEPVYQVEVQVPQRVSLPVIAAFVAIKRGCEVADVTFITPIEYIQAYQYYVDIQDPKAIAFRNTTMNHSNGDPTFAVGVKAIRDATGLGLKEAKEFYDNNIKYKTPNGSWIKLTIKFVMPV